MSTMRAPVDVPIRTACSSDRRARRRRRADCPMCCQRPSIRRSMTSHRPASSTTTFGSELPEIGRPLRRPLGRRRGRRVARRGHRVGHRRGPCTPCCEGHRSRAGRRCRCSRRRRTAVGWPGWRIRGARPPSHRRGGSGPAGRCTGHRPASAPAIAAAVAGRVATTVAATTPQQAAPSSWPTPSTR